MTILRLSTIKFLSSVVPSVFVDVAVRNLEARKERGVVKTRRVSRKMGGVVALTAASLFAANSVGAAGSIADTNAQVFSGSPRSSRDLTLSRASTT